MLGDNAAIATVAVTDMEKAREFYRDALGLKLVDDRPEVMTFKSGPSMLFVYQSQFAGTNKATSVNWSVKDVGEVVAALKDRGVTFEHYDMPGLEVRGDIHVGGGMTVAWFKDPDGNILSVVSEG